MAANGQRGGSAGSDGERRAGEARTPVWVYGINDHLDIATEIPQTFKPSGSLRSDCRALCGEFGAAPHPSFKIKRKPAPVERGAMLQRRPSKLEGLPSTPVPPTPQGHPDGQPIPEGPLMSIRSTLMDRTSMCVLSLALPHAVGMKVLCFSDANLDCEMLRLLRIGLSGACSLESLQIEWNIMDLPLPAAEDSEVLPADVDDHPIQRLSSELLPPEPRGGQFLQRKGSSGNQGAQIEGSDAGAASSKGEASLLNGPGHARLNLDLEARERRRYTMQSHRNLRSFREWIEMLHGSLEAAWQQLQCGKADLDLSLSAGEFHETLSEHLSISGPQVLEIFEVLDGPDYVEGQGRTSLAMLRAALEGLPEEAIKDDPNDPIGVSIAHLLDGDSVIESLSLRACALTRQELVPVSAALCRCPWQLRILNLYDNRICDYGATLLATVLDRYRGLQFLGLGRNRITDAGMESLCKPFEPVLLDEEAAKPFREGITQQQAEATAQEAAKQKAQATGFTSRQKRAPLCLVDELEERPPAKEDEGARPTFLLRRQTELRCLVLSENPIKSGDKVEALQPHGPKGAEMVLRGTPAAVELVAKRPELASIKDKKGLIPQMSLPVVQTAPVDGWLLRVA
mmetsp:Transcript_74409/g.120105  ORF Transcript_74409/g.120105 Transcript_74409/m.120105 type:complete len:626 (-) Transcript_74409:100-1977(-)